MKHVFKEKCIDIMNHQTKNFSKYTLYQNINYQYIYMNFLNIIAQNLPMNFI